MKAEIDSIFDLLVRKLGHRIKKSITYTGNPPGKMGYCVNCNRQVRLCREVLCITGDVEKTEFNHVIARYYDVDDLNEEMGKIVDDIIQYNDLFLCSRTKLFI